VVRWDEAEGWGVLVSPAVDGECFALFSDIEMEGYRSLRAGQSVSFECETPGQDGYPYRAGSVRPG
jgi:CspA family cold shock protein